MSKVLGKIVSSLSGVIAVTGSVTNALSLSYFVRKTERTLSNRIFIFLNMFDLLVCICNVVMVSAWYCTGPQCGPLKPFFTNAFAIIFSLVDGTAFATCLLSVTRAISLSIPFYQIRKGAVGIASLILLAQEVVRFTLRLSYPNSAFYKNLDVGLIISVLAIVILVSLFSSVLSAWKLLGGRKKLGVVPGNDSKSAPRTNQKATVTIIIVSFLFCFLSTISCITLLLQYRGVIPQTLLMELLYQFSLWLAIPLNSAINPVIYFTRKRDMRRYIWELFTNTWKPVTVFTSLSYWLLMANISSILCWQLFRWFTYPM